MPGGRALLGEVSDLPGQTHDHPTGELRSTETVPIGGAKEQRKGGTSVGPGPSGGLEALCSLSAPGACPTPPPSVSLMCSGPHPRAGTCSRETHRASPPKLTSPEREASPWPGSALGLIPLISESTCLRRHTSRGSCHRPDRGCACDGDTSIRCGGQPIAH